MEQEKAKALEALIQKDYNNTAGVAVLKDGEMIYEHYFNGCSADSTIHVYSVTKSIISILFGIALDKGYIKDVRQNILDFFPDYTIKKREKTIQHITLEDMLTMTAPYKYKFAPYLKYFTSNDWVTFTLDLLGGKGQIGDFRYAPLIGPDILSGILIKATGQSVFDFAAENLFSPLGIHVEQNIVFRSKEEQMAFNKATNISGWVTDESGTNSGGWGLTLSPMDMAKIGQLYLNEGMWHGRQIVPASWVAASTKEHSRWQQQNLSYGYLWWTDVDKNHSYAAMGDGGNIIYVNPEKKIVVAMACLFVPRAKNRLELIDKGFFE